MTRVGPWIVDPVEGMYCTIRLDTCEKILLHEDHSGRLVIERLKWLGLGSDRVFACDLKSGKGRAIATFLTRHAEPGRADAVPFGAFVKFLRKCGSVEEVESACRAMSRIIADATAGAPGGDRTRSGPSWGGTA